MSNLWEAAFKKFEGIWSLSFADILKNWFSICKMDQIWRQLYCLLSFICVSQDHKASRKQCDHFLFIKVCESVYKKLLSLFLKSLGGDIVRVKA